MYIKRYLIVWINAILGVGSTFVYFVQSTYSMYMCILHASYGVVTKKISEISHSKKPSQIFFIGNSRSGDLQRAAKADRVPF